MKRTTLCLLSVFTLLSATSCGYAVEEIEGNAPAPAMNIQSEVQLESGPIGEEPTEQPTMETASSLEDVGLAQPDKMLSKEELYYRCMNTLLYMDQLSGHIVSKDTKNSPTVFDGTIAYDFVEKKYYTISTSWLADDLECCVDVAEVFVNDGMRTSFHSNKEGAEKFQNDTIQQDTYDITKGIAFDQNDYTIEVPKDSAKAILSADLSTEDIFAEPSFYQTNGLDPTGAHELAGCFVPQEMSSGFMSDFSKWEIADTEELDGRTCAVVKGTTTESYGKQMGLASFEIWVDQETGVWLWYEGYDENGEVQSYVYTDNMQFGSDAQQVTCLTKEMLHEKLDGGQYELSNYTVMDVEALEANYLKGEME